MIAVLSLMLLTAPDGRVHFFDPGLGPHGVACGDCHATPNTEGDGRRRAGHSLAGVGRRPYWRGDERRAQFRDLGAAIAPCVEIYQGGTALPPAIQEPLVAWLRSLPGPRDPVAIQPALVADLDYGRTLRGGDPRPGRQLYYRACHGCHPHGSQPGIAGVVAGTPAADVARSIREGTGLLRGQRQPGAWMPFYGADRLSDIEVAHIAAFVSRLPPPASDPAPTPAPPPDR
jgi:cytochrome c553